MKIDFSITSYCNAACPSCKRYPNFNNLTIDSPTELNPKLRQIHVDFNDFKSIIERNIHNFKDKRATYEGELGDSLVHPDIESFIDYGCSVFRSLTLVTNGGVRNSSFYKKIGDKYKNLEMVFSIDGMGDDTNQIYRKRVRTERALLNMTTYATTLYGKGHVYWQFLLFNHNYFEVPDALLLSKTYKIKIYLKFNQRPKFIINEKRKKI
ncbi:uncharacterized protein METZ01_LOCUS404961, partial [marine metagenome]